MEGTRNARQLSLLGTMEEECGVVPTGGLALVCLTELLEFVSRIYPC